MGTPKYYTAEDLDAMNKDELELIAEARGVEVEGTGADGRVLVTDLEDAITADQDTSGVNPALQAVPVAETSGPRRYRVTARTEVFERKPGSVFTATIPAWQEQMLVEAGALALADDPATSSFDEATGDWPAPHGDPQDDPTIPPQEEE